jgi:membrane protease YdiL (CAAX protease family)
MGGTAYWLTSPLVQALCCIVVSVPFVIAAVRSACLQDRKVSLHDLGLLAIFFVADLIVVRLDLPLPFMRMPWQAMILETSLALAVIGATRSARASGLTLRVEPQAWRVSLAVTGLLLAFVVARSLVLKRLGLGASDSGSISAEYLVYLLIMPGLAEELAYRGVIQSNLNTMLGRPWKLFGAQIGWGWIITGVVFWAMHAFRVDPQVRLSFYWPTLTMQLIVGFALGWLRERSGSLFPAMVAHNLVNVAWMLL